MKRYLRFGMRSLFLLTLVCLMLAWLVSVLHRAQQQREAVAWVLQHEGWVLYDWQRDKKPGAPGPKWLRDTLGDDCFQEVVRVRVFGKSVDDLTRFHTQFSTLFPSP